MKLTLNLGIAQYLNGFLLVSVILIALCLRQESVAGRGLVLSFNVAIVGCVAMFFLFFFILRVMQIRGRFTLSSTRAFLWLLLASVVLYIPLLYAPVKWQPEAAWRLTGLILGVAFFFCCLQVRYTHRQVYSLICAILLAVCVQAVFALQQLFIPAWSWAPLYGQRVYGTFFQPNVLASFIATGVALSLTLLLLPGFALVQARYENWRKWILASALFIFSLLLVVIQSRAGWLGGIAVVLIFLWRFGKLSIKRSTLVATALLLGALMGISLLLFGETAAGTINHEHSNQARWTMLRDTLAMIAQKPMLGWGYGGFEYSFQHFRINQIPPTIVTEIARHPHNEILLWVSEGGAVALVGVLLLAVAGGRVVLQAWRRDRQAVTTSPSSLAGVATSLCIALLPILIHMQLEYPFYLSILHFVVFLLLFAMADRIGGGVMARRACSPTCSALVAGTIVACALAVAVVMGFALKGNLAIAKVERFGMVDIEQLNTLPALSAWVHRERVTFDKQVHGLLTYNRTHDERLLEAYSQWAQQYLMRRIDKNVYASLIVILQHQEQHVAAEFYRRDAVRLFPTDIRFQVNDAEHRDEGDRQ
ncbi:Wzy polymerase domain-containing protein [Serratia marcescens]